VAEDPNHPWGSGATRYYWVPDVRATVQRALNRYPRLTANTYVCHPWCGWSPYSVDYWDAGGRGDPVDGPILASLRQFLMELPGKPFIRHTILDHALWTSWGGYSYWAPLDHTGYLRHLHVTYWR
jgi:hypothetical protein